MAATPRMTVPCLHHQVPPRFPVTLGVQGPWCPASSSNMDAPSGPRALPALSLYPGGLRPSSAG